MPNHDLISALHDALRKHGKPSSEDPVWATVLMLQGLQFELLEKIMSSVQDLAKAASDEAAALVDLNSSVAAFVASPPASGGGTPSPIGLSPADQTVLDTAVSTVNSNIEKIGEIKALLGTPTAVPPPSGGGSTPSEPSSPPATGDITPVKPST